jgi:hypothetical protein
MLFHCWVYYSLYFLVVLLLEVTGKLSWFQMMFLMFSLSSLRLVDGSYLFAVCGISCVRFHYKCLNFWHRPDATWIQQPSNVKLSVCTIICLFCIREVFYLDNRLSPSSSSKVSLFLRTNLLNLHYEVLFFLFHITHVLSHFSLILLSKNAAVLTLLTGFSTILVILTDRNRHRASLTHW